MVQVITLFTITGTGFTGASAKLITDGGTDVLLIQLQKLSTQITGVIAKNQVYQMLVNLMM
jgi:hypothetical protein